MNILPQTGHGNNKRNGYCREQTIGCISSLHWEEIGHCREKVALKSVYNSLVCSAWMLIELISKHQYEVFEYLGCEILNFWMILN